MTTKIIDNENDEISIREILLKLSEWLKYLLSKWVLILSFALIGGLLGFVYAKFKAPLYTASTTFVLESGESGGGLGQYAGLASMVGIDIGGSGGGIFQGENIIELYKSRTMIEKALLSEIEFQGKKQLLIDSYIQFNNLRDKWKDKPNLQNISFTNKSKYEMSNFTRLQDSILTDIVSEINKSYLLVSKPDKKLSIIRVDVTAKDEFFAKNFNDQIVKNVNDFYIQTKTKKSIDNVTILTKKTDSVRSTMNGAIYAAATIADATPNLNPTRQVQRVAPMQRSQYNAETNKAILGELVKNLELSKMSLLKETPLIQVVDQPVFPLHKVIFSKIKGLVLGAIISSFIIILFLTIKNISLT